MEAPPSVHPPVIQDIPQYETTHFVRCLRCLKVIRCTRYDTLTLINHIRTEHPEVEIADAPQQPQRENGGGTKMDGAGSAHIDTPAQKNSAPHVTISGGLAPDANPVNYNDISQCKRSPSPAMSNNEKRERWLYRTSIEKWRPATGTLFCPKCGANKQPLIKTRTERMSGNTCGAACLLGCWPFCFLPFLCSGEDKEYLYCSSCKSFLGLFDPTKNCIRPNLAFLGSQENVSKRSPRQSSERSNATD